MILAWLGCAVESGSLKPVDTSKSPPTSQEADADVDADSDSDTDPGTEPPQPRIPLFVNEIVSQNRTSATDERAEAGDWIELYNAGLVDLPLAGFSITDSVDNPAKHLFDPSLVVPSQGFLVLWADSDAEVAANHLGFSINSDGDDIAIYDADGAVVSRVDFGPLARDMALARTADGGADFTITLEPTPGASNGAADGSMGIADAEPPGACDPVATVVASNLTEGEDASVVLSCGSDLDPSTLTTQVLTASPDPVWASPNLTWTTGLEDAGRVDALFAVRPTGFVGVPETVVGTVWTADDWSNPANVLVDPLLYEEEWGLPVLHLDPAGVVGQDYSAMHAWFRGVEYTGQMKIRGAASAGYPKPSYTLEFDPEQLDLSDDGLQNKDHLVVISNFDDSTYVRQKMIFDTWEAMALREGTPRLAPRSFFLVIYLNGRYWGLFTGVDHPDDEFQAEMGFNSEANLYKAVDHNANFYLTNTYGSAKSSLHQGYEKKEGEPAGDFADLDDLVEFTGSSTHAEFDAEADAWLDRDEFQDWFTLVHWTSSADSAGKNAYLYNDPNALMWHYVPWDFNHSYGQNWYTARVTPNVYEDFMGNNAVFWHFQDDPAMAAALWSRFDSMRLAGQPLALTTQQALMLDYYDEIEPSCQRDWDKWVDPYWDYWAWARSDRNDFVDERAYLEQWLLDRDGWMTYYH